MIHLAWPWMAAILPLPWLLHRWRSAAPPRGEGLFLPFVTALRPGSVNPRGGRAPGLGLLAANWLLRVAAALRPQWLGEPQPAPTTGRRIVLAVDVSGSMATRDMADDASRLQVVQAVAGQFIDGRRGDQVGLILFGTQPYVQAPLTTDLATVHRFLDEAVVGVAGTETAIGDAIGLALKRLRDAAGAGGADSVTGVAGGVQGDATGAAAAEAAGNAAGNAPGNTAGAGHTVLILLTDGQNDAGVMDPLQAADYAAQGGLRIYTVGVGALPPHGIFAPADSDDLDEETLRAIARRTGGQYFRAADVDTLEAVYREIDALEPVAGRDQWLRPADEWFFLPLAVALLLSVPAAWAGGRAWR